MALSKINTRALANDSVTVDKVADNAVTTAMITDGTIGVTDLADGAITNAKVSSTAAIDASKLNLSGVTSAGITTLTGQDINLYNATDGNNALRFYDDDDLLSGGLYVWNSRLNIASYNSQDISLAPAGNVNLTSGSFQVGGTTVIDSSRNVSGTRGTFTVDDNAEYSDTEDSELNPVGSDALYLYNNESTSTNGKVSLLMRSTGSGGGAAGRITLENSRSGAGAFNFFLRDNSHTGEQQAKLTLNSDGDLNFPQGRLMMNGSTAINQSRQGYFGHGTTVGNGATTPTDGGTLQLTRSNNNPYIGFYSDDGTRNGYIQSIGSGPMYFANEEGGGWHFNNGANVMSVTDGGSISIGGGTNQTWAQLAIRKSNDAAGIALESGATNGLTYEMQSGPNGNFLFYDRTNSRYLYSGINTQQDWYVSSAVAMRLNSDGLQVSTGGLGMTSSTKTYRNEINNSSTAFSGTGTLYINTALNGSGEGVLISSQTRTTNEYGTSMFRLIDRAGAEAFRVNVDGSMLLNGQIQNSEVNITSYKSYNSSADKSLFLGTSNDTAQNNYRFHKYRLNVSGDANGQDFKIIGNRRITGEQTLFTIDGYNGNPTFTADQPTLALGFVSNPSNNQSFSSQLRLGTKGNTGDVVRNAHWDIRAEPESYWGNPKLAFNKVYDGTNYGQRASISSGGTFSCSGGLEAAYIKNSGYYKGYNLASTGTWQTIATISAASDKSVWGHLQFMFAENGASAWRDFKFSVVVRHNGTAYGDFWNYDNVAIADTQSASGSSYASMRLVSAYGGTNDDKVIQIYNSSYGMQVYVYSIEGYNTNLITWS